MNTLKEFIQALPCTVMRFWQDLLDSLNSDGGHIFLLGLFVILCNRYTAMSNHEELFLGALLGYLKGAGSNKTRRDRPTPTAETSTATVETVSVTEPKPEAPKE